jgi:hypothetical protein
VLDQAFTRGQPGGNQHHVDAGNRAHGAA